MPDERRTCRRLPVAPEAQWAVARIGRAEVPCRCVNVSAGGVAIELESPESLKAGMQVELETCDGVQTMRVAHVRRSGETVGAGLIRVDDESGSDDPVARVRRLRLRGRRLFPGRLALSVLVWAAALAGVSLGPQWWSTNVIGPARRSLGRVFCFDADWELPDLAQSGAARGNAGDGGEHRSASSESYAERRRASDDADAPRDPPRAGRQQPDISWAAWASALKLSDAQARALQSRLSRSGRANSPAEVAELSDEEKREIYDLLTPIQRQQLNTFLKSRSRPKR